MKRNISLALLAATALALALVAVDMAFTFASVRQLRADAARVQHSNDVLIALHSVFALAKDAEAGQRGYVITGKAEILQLYRASALAIGRELDGLDALVRGEPEQQPLLAQLRSSLEARLGELDFAVAVRERSGFAAAQEIMQLGSGRATIEALRSSRAAMEALERRRLDAREAEAAASYRHAVVAVLAAGTALLVGVIAFALLMRRHLAARDRAEAALGAEAERLRTTLASIGDAVITTGVDGRVARINAVAEALTGWSRDDAAGQELGAVFRIVDEATRAPVADTAMRVPADGEPAGAAEARLLIRKDGVERPIDASVAPIVTAEGGVAGAVLVFRDVSARQRGETALREAEARLRRVLMGMAVPTMAYAEDGSVVLVNDAWIDGTGYSRAELTQLADWTSRAYPARAGFMHQHIGSLFALTRRVDSGEREVTTAAGETRIWHFYTAPIGRDGAGRRQLVTNAIDVTDRRRIEARLQQSDSRLRFALDAAGLGQWELDAGGLSVYRSLSHDRIFGHDELLPEWSYERFLGHVVADDRERVDTAYQEAMTHVGVWDVECRIRRRDGAVRHVWIRASAHREGGDGSGGVGMLALVGDVTRERAALAALKEAGLAPATPPPVAAVVVAPAVAGLRILVVEDNDDSADALVLLLGLAGHEARVARSGAEALAAMPTLQPELVLLDIGLPDMSGYEVCRRLRALAAEPRPIIVAVTGWGREDDRRHSRAAGFDGHLVKPLGLQQLADVIAQAG